MGRYNVTLKPMGLLRHIEIDTLRRTPETAQSLEYTGAHQYPFTAIFEAGLGKEASDYWKWSWGIPHKRHWEFEHDVADSDKVRTAIQEHFERQFGARYKGISLHNASYFTQDNGDAVRNDPVTGTPSRLNISEFGLNPSQKWYITTGLVVLEEVLQSEPTP